ncbi:MAG: hypothetical protein S4CHLAM6_15470 [Chlamydiae bacterium]|nr:hypothetical protein [Chlamydiota bacterium]
MYIFWTRASAFKAEKIIELLLSYEVLEISEVNVDSCCLSYLK